MAKNLFLKFYSIELKTAKISFINCKKIVTSKKHIKHQKNNLNVVIRVASKIKLYKN